MLRSTRRIWPHWEAYGGSSELTSIRSDAFALSNDEKIKQIEHYFAKIMDTIGLDFSDDSLRETLRRFSNIRQRNVQWVKSSQ